MRTTIITKRQAYALLDKAGIKPVLPYRGYATAINSTDRIAVNSAGDLLLITGDKEQGQAYTPSPYNVNES